MVITLNEVDLDLASRRRDEYPLVDFQLCWVLSMVSLRAALRDLPSRHHFQTIVEGYSLSVSSSRHQTAHRKVREENLQMLRGTLGELTSFGGNGDHPVFLAGTARCISKFFYSAAELWLALSTQRDMLESVKESYAV